MTKSEEEYAKAAAAMRRYLAGRGASPERVAARREHIHRYKRRYPEKIAAHWAVYSAIKRGRLVRPDRCSRCGILCKPEGSHDDYSKPLEVEWLCRRCHKRKDRKVH